MLSTQITRGARWGALLCAVVVVAACVKLQWQAIYAGPHDYSFASDVYVGDSGNVYMSGILDPGHAFVAAYDGAGSLLWDKQIESDVAGRPYFRWGTESMVEDADGNFYWAKSAANPFTTSIYKFSGDGELLFSWTTQNPYVDASLQFGPDGELYVTDSNGSGVEAFSVNGDSLWNYGADMPSPPLVNGVNTLVFWNDAPVLLSNDTVTVFDSAGNVAQSVSASLLLFDRILNMAVRNNQLMLVTLVGEEVEWVILNESLQVASRFLLQDGEPSFTLLSVDGDAACVSLTDLSDEDYGPKKSMIASLNLNGAVEWQTEVVAQAENWNYPVLKAAGSDCYFGVGALALEGSATSIIQRYRADGSKAEKITLTDYVLEDLEVIGNDIYQVGITGAYDGSITEATLLKHQLY